MRVMFTSTSAELYNVGDRVAYKFADNEWYLGTVTKFDNAKASIHFDDDEKYTVSIRSKLCKVDHPKKSTNFFSDAEIQALKIKAPKSPRSTNLEKSTPVKREAQEGVGLRRKVLPKEALILGVLNAEFEEAESMNSTASYDINPRGIISITRITTSDQGEKGRLVYNLNLSDLDAAAKAARKYVEQLTDGVRSSAKFVKKVIGNGYKFSDVIVDRDELDTLCDYLASN